MTIFDPKVRRQLKHLKPEIESYLKANVSNKRFEHIVSVVKLAKRYAKKLGLDHHKVELSAWLHDVAKEIPNEKLLEIAKKNNFELDEIDLENPHVLHSMVGATIAKEKFGIDDPDVLAGIRCHTLAEPDMNKISMVVYLADASEPGRDRKKAAPLRKAFKEEGLERAVLKAIDSKLVDVIERGKKIHPMTIKARNWLLSILSSSS